VIAPAAGVLLGEARRHPGRLLLTGLAVLVATVFSAGSLTAAATLRAHVAESARATPDGAAAVVRVHELPEIPVDPQRLVAAAGAVDGVAEAVGVWSAALPVTGAGPRTSWDIRSDPMTGPLTRLPPLDAGRLPAADGEVLLERTTAERTGLGPGARLRVEPEGGSPVEVTAVGVVGVPTVGVNALVLRPGAAAVLGGYLESVDLAAAPGAAEEVLADRVGAALGAPGAVSTGTAARAEEAERVSEEITAVLLGVGVFAGLALVAAAVVVASTFRIVLTQRRTQLALLRCVGARRGQVVGAVLAEAVVSGLLAGLLAIAVVAGGGHALRAALGAAGVDTPPLVLPWGQLAACVAVAVAATVLAALAPALAASRIPPVAALGAAGAGDAGTARPLRRLPAAAALAAVATAMAWAASRAGGTPDLALVVLAASGMVAFAALVVAGPVLVHGLAATAGRAVALLGRAPGRLAVANAGQVPRRTATTISVLALGTGLASALLVGLSSTEVEVQRTIAESYPADVAVRGGDAPALAAAADAHPALVVVARDEGAVHLDPEGGADGGAVRQAVDALVADRDGLVVMYRADARAEVESLIGMLRLVGLGLVGMTLLVAVVGVAVTLALSVAERTRETGLLRAVGLTRRGVRAMVAWEAALTGTGAALVGAALGALYGVLGLAVLDVGVGFTADALPPLAALVLAVVAVAALAAVAPAVRAGRVPPIRALQDA
jgi:putative ABC transport system permease protein